jgi:hypothetical protein
MKQLPKRGPVVLWTGPGESRLIAELFEAKGQLVVMGAFWPEADSPPAAAMVDPARIMQEGNEGAPWLIYAMPEDDDDALWEQWAKWLKRRDQEGTTREDARQNAESGLDIDIKEVNGDTVELR